MSRVPFSDMFQCLDNGDKEQFQLFTVSICKVIGCDKVFLRSWVKTQIDVPELLYGFSLQNWIDSIINPEGKIMMNTKEKKVGNYYPRAERMLTDEYGDDLQKFVRVDWLSSSDFLGHDDSPGAYANRYVNRIKGSCVVVLENRSFFTTLKKSKSKVELTTSNTKEVESYMLLEFESFFVEKGLY